VDLLNKKIMDIVSQIVKLEEYYQDTKVLLPEAEEQLQLGIQHFQTMGDDEDLEEFENALRALYQNVMNLRMQFKYCELKRAELWN
jgi:hypothetical protein